MKKCVIAIVGLLVCCTSVMGEGGDEPKLSFETTGDSVYEFEIKAKFDPAPDVSSPSGAVTAWCMLTDGRAGAPNTNLKDRWNRLVAEELSRLEGELLTDELVESQVLERADKEPSHVSVDKPTKIVEEVKIDDSNMYVITEQETESKWKTNKGEWESNKRNNRTRYKVSLGDDGNWRIAAVGSADRKRSKEDSEESWRARDPKRLEIALELHLTESPAFQPPTLDMSGPNEAALSFCNGLRSFVEDAKWQPLVVVSNAIMEVCQDWFTEGYIAAVTSNVERRLERSKERKKEASVPEVLEVRRDEAGTGATVVFKKTDSKAANQLAIKLKKVGGDWRVSEVLNLWKHGTEDEWFEVKDDIYSRA